MKTKEEIKEKIENIKNEVVSDVSGFVYTNQSLLAQAHWITALEWVLGKDENT